MYFESKGQNDTLISWYKDEASLQDNSPGHYTIISTFSGSLHGKTELTFGSIGRRDKGEYRVVIENTHGIIPSEQRRVEAQFTVDVSILPATPINLSVIADQSSTVIWSLRNMTVDESADYQNVTIYSTDGSVAAWCTVDGLARHAVFSLTPGQMYSVEVTAVNQDGKVTSEAYLFQTQPGGMLIYTQSIKLLMLLLF